MFKGKLSMDLYLENVRKKYKKARKKEKGEIIAEALLPQLIFKLKK